MSYDASRVAFVDTETTGLDPELDFIWEIAVIVDGEEYVWQQRLPERRGEPDWDVVSEWVIENTRITRDYDHEAALEPFHSIANLETLVRGRHLVGACPWFDSERLHRAQLRESDHRDLLWHYHLIDVENLAVGWLHGAAAFSTAHAPSEFWDGFGKLPWKSTDLSLALGVDPADFEPKHSALADARWAKAIYEKIMGPPR